jgi:putative IMPACT (imprinted ancient) family translation regulator
MSQKRARSPSPLSTDQISQSTPILDRSSKFIALYSPILNAQELQAQHNIKSASHRITAWRKPSSQRALRSQRLFDTGHDDDGEKYGGKTLSTVLASMEVEGAIVVARWYGGVMLGPARFDHIRDSAREAITAWRQESEKASKRLRAKEDIKNRDQLARILQERDHSITVLRSLLAEKTKSISSDLSPPNTPAKVPQYSTLPLLTLTKLEKVRDATIGWILKQIEAAEVAQQADIETGAVEAPARLELPEASTGNIVAGTETMKPLACKNDVIS